MNSSTLPPTAVAITGSRDDKAPGGTLTEASAKTAIQDYLDALTNGDDETVAVGSDHFEERSGGRLDVPMHEHVARGIEDADVEALGVEIDAAVVPMLTAVESHGSSSCADDALGPAVQPTRRSSRCRRGAWMRIKALQLSGLH